MKSAVIVSLLLAIYMPVSIAAGKTNCTCRAKNIVVPEGQTVCLWTANGGRLARCERVLNNTSWVFLPGSCEEEST